MTNSDKELTIINAGDLPLYDELVAEFLDADQTWYLIVDGDRVSLPKIIERLQQVEEHLNRTLKLE